jgi:hypothetical protein
LFVLEEEAASLSTSIATRFPLQVLAFPAQNLNAHSGLSTAIGPIPYLLAVYHQKQIDF